MHRLLRERGTSGECRAHAAQEFRHSGIAMHAPATIEISPSPQRGQRAWREAKRTAGAVRYR
jgi:hypothetical protein